MSLSNDKQDDKFGLSLIENIALTFNAFVLFDPAQQIINKQKIEIDKKILFEKKNI